ncbi:MAG: hypothetical protein LM580_06465 [Thermofilum sp.]|nr:hypothetical protein [Thermofilum sp.]
MSPKAKLAAVTLGVWGTALAVYSYLVLGSVPLAALGVGALIVSASILSTYEESPYSEAARASLEAYAVNVARLLEEFGASEPALYTRGGLAIVPLNGKLPEGVKPSSERLLGGARGSYFLSIALPNPPIEAGDPEAALASLLVDTLGLCDGVKVARSGDRVIVEIAKPKVRGEAARFESVLGPLPVHLAASALAVAMGADLKLEGWRREGSSLVAALRVVEGAGEG